MRQDVERTERTDEHGNVTVLREEEVGGEYAVWVNERGNTCCE